MGVLCSFDVCCRCSVTACIRCLSVSLSKYRSLSIRFSVSMYLCLFVSVSIYLSVSLSSCLCHYLRICLLPLIPLSKTILMYPWRLELGPCCLYITTSFLLLLLHARPRVTPYTRIVSNLYLVSTTFKTTMFNSVLPYIATMGAYSLWTLILVVYRWKSSLAVSVSWICW